MSQVARVFVVLNLLVAAGFLFAAATFLALNNDYKEKLAAEQKAHAEDNQAKDLEISKLNDEIKSKDGQNQALREQVGNKDGIIASQNTQIQSLEANNKAKDASIAALTTANSEHAKMQQTLQASVTDWRAKAEAFAAEARTKTDEAKAAIAAKEAAEKMIEDQKATIHGHEKTIAAQKESISNLELMKSYAISKGVDFEKIQLIGPLAGHVVAADNNLKLVQINIGKDKGVVRGAVLDVVRGSTYIGRLEIDTVMDNHAAGLMTIMKDGQSVMVGDRVTNTLN